MFVADKFNCFYLLSGHLDFKYFLYICVVGFVFFAYNFRHYFKNILYTVGVLAFVAGAGYNSYFRLNDMCVHDNLNFFGLFAFNFADVLVLAGLLIICAVVYYYTYGTTNTSNQ